MKTVLDAINEHLDEITKIAGVTKISELMAARLGVSADDCKPFILATALQVMVASGEYRSLTLAACAVASERIGWDWEAETRNVLGLAWPGNDGFKTITEYLASKSI